MTRRDWMVTATAAAAAQRTRPNIVFICSDDHHYQCLGAAGNPHIRTPNLDRLVSRGVLFSNGVISTPQCAPSRGILLSGQEIYQNGLESNGRTSFREGQGPTIVQQLNRAGYDTVLVGKWHIRPSPESCGFAKAPLWLRPAASRYVNPVLCRGLNGADQETPGHITELFTSAATEYIRGAKQPFLLWLTYNAPHTPWPAGGAHRKQYEDRSSQLAPPAHPRNAQEFDWVTYYSVITHLDEAIGRVIGAVEEAGLWDNTLIVFLGDNGYLCGTKGLSGKVYPWEESIRVPYCASGGMVRARGKVETPVASIDLPATFLDYAGVRPFYSLSGQSLRLELDTGKSRRQAAFVSWTDGRPEALMIMRAVEPYRVVRTAAHKYIVWESRKQALFDLRADPAEENDLSGHSTHAKLLRSMREHLMRRMRVTGDPARAWLG